MKKNTKQIIIYCICAVLIGALGVNNYKLRSFKLNSQKKMEELKKESKEYYIEKINLGHDNKKLKEELEDTSFMSVWRDEIDKIDEEFKWLEDKKWNKLIISKEVFECDGNSEEYESIVSSKEILSDSIFFINPYEFMYWTRETYEPPSGFKPCSAPKYIYKYIGDDSEFTIRVEDEKRFSIDGINDRVFQSEHDFFLKLGDAFMDNDCWNTVGNIYTKIAQSGCIASDKIVSYSPWRINFVASSISDMKELKGKPQIDLSKEKERMQYKAYYYGDTIEMNTYGKYLQIVDGNKEYWFVTQKGSDEYTAAFIIGHILFGIC